MINNFEPMVAAVSVVQVVMIAIVLLSTRMLGADAWLVRPAAIWK